jgi:hypothetical protein
LYDKAFAVDEATTGVVPFSKYSDMEAFTKKKLDALIAFTASQSYSYSQAEFPVSVVAPGGTYGVGTKTGAGFTSSVLNRLANTWAAQLLAYSPRTAAEASSADWASVLAYAKKGIGSGAGSAFDFSVLGDGGNNWYDLLTGYFDLPSWMMIDVHLISQMAPNVPSSYTGLPASPASAYDAVWAPSGTYDARLSIDLSDVNSYISGVDDATDFVYARQVQGSAARGIYMQSPYYHVRYINYSYQANNSFIGPQPWVLAAENDLLEAEALVRTHGDKALAAALVNNTRVNRGHLTPLTAATADADFLKAITYELEVECVATDGYGFFALRGMDQLQNGTLRHLPVPATELSTDNVPVYTFGGVGLPDMSMLPGSAEAPAGTFDPQKFEAGPWKSLDLPNGSMMLLPAPFTPPHPRGPGLDRH